MYKSFRKHFQQLHFQWMVAPVCASQLNKNLIGFSLQEGKADTVS